MTSSSPVPAPVSTAPPAGASATPPGELGPNLPLWFLAHCDPCGGESFAEPFRRQADRDTWAVDHLLATGHTVRLSIDDVPSDTHLAAYLRRVDAAGEAFQWLCPSTDCARWIGPHETPQLALADWRGHATRIGVAR
jgi:hypothetical protein